MSGSRPSLWVFAGPNGAGKSTLVRRYSVDSRVNPDDLAEALNVDGGNATYALAKAGRMAVERRAHLLATGQSFGVETTLTGRSELQLMRTAKERGYKVSLVYLGLADADQSNSPVTARVRRGGHDVPERDIYR